MALIQSIIKKFREKQNEPVEEIDDDETRDKYYFVIDKIINR